MQDSDNTNYVIVTGVFSGFEVFVTIVAILRKTSRPAAVLRFLAFIPLVIYGAVAIQSAFKQRYDLHGQISKTGAVWLGQAIHGVVGLAAAVWALVSGWVFQRSKKKMWPSSVEWESGRWSTASFYLSIVDCCFFVAIAVGLGYTSSFTPWHLGQCDSYGIYSSWPISEAGRAGECERMLTIQIMAILALPMIACHLFLNLPVLAPPTPFRAQAFLLARALRLRQPRTKPDEGWQDLEKAALSNGVRGEEASLVAMFREDAIASSLARHLHFEDIANMSQTSRRMRGAVFAPSQEQRRGRFNMVCESACMEGSEKSECWACARVICDVCRSRRNGLPCPRTEGHLQHCYALCTKCYIFIPETQPAKFAATWNPRDLSVQHRSCWSRTAPLPTVEEPVYLCPSCQRLSDDDVVIVREGRDEANMRLALRRRVRCKKCERALPKGRRRWWICSKGFHDCHWAGHEVM